MFSYKNDVHVHLMYCQVHWCEVTWKMHTIVDEQRANHTESWLKNSGFLSYSLATAANNNKFYECVQQQFQFFSVSFAHTFWFKTNAEGKIVVHSFLLQRNYVRKSDLFTLANEFQMQIETLNIQQTISFFFELKAVYPYMTDGNLLNFFCSVITKVNLNIYLNRVENATVEIRI